MGDFRFRFFLNTICIRITRCAFNKFAVFSKRKANSLRMNTLPTTRVQILKSFSRPTSRVTTIYHSKLLRCKTLNRFLWNGVTPVKIELNTRVEKKNVENFRNFLNYNYFADLTLVHKYWLGFKTTIIYMCYALCPLGQLRTAHQYCVSLTYQFNKGVKTNV